jgi:hypothetical protein
MVPLLHGVASTSNEPGDTTLNDGWWDRFTRQLSLRSSNDGRDGSATFRVEREQRLVHGRLHDRNGASPSWLPHALDPAAIEGDPAVAADDVYCRWGAESDAQAAGRRSTT